MEYSFFGLKTFSKRFWKKYNFSKNSYEVMINILEKKGGFEPNLLKNLSILDFGCGNAEILSLLEKKNIGEKRCGIDIYKSEEKYERAKSRAPSAIIKKINPYQKIPFKNKFDVVISNQVFEHVEKKNIMFEQINNCLKDNGVLIASFPSKDVIMEPHMKLPFIHLMPKRSKWQKAYLFFAYIFNLGCFTKKEKKYKKNLFRIRQNYVNNNLFHYDFRWYKKNLNKYFPYISEVNTFYLNNLNEGSKIKNIIKIIISEINSEFLRNYLTKIFIGNYIICRKFKNK